MLRRGNRREFASSVFLSLAWLAPFAWNPTSLAAISVKFPPELSVPLDRAARSRSFSCFSLFLDHRFDRSNVFFSSSSSGIFFWNNSGGMRKLALSLD